MVGVHVTPTAPTRYARVAIALHWVIALAIVFQIILGWRMGNDDHALPGPVAFALFQLHKSVGITILLLSLGRLAWRLTHAAPPSPAGQPGWEQLASKVVHASFYVIMIGLPITGWIVVSTSKTNIPTLLYGVIPWPHVPGLAELAAAPKHQWHQVGGFGHNLLVKFTYLLLFLHLGAVAKHQILDRDEVLSHMAPGAKPGWLEPRAWLAAAALAAVIAAGYLYWPTTQAAPLPPPPAPASAPAAAVPAGADTANAVAAQTPAPTSAEPTPAGPWTVKAGSTLGFTSSWSGQAIEGAFRSWDAHIVFSPDDLTHSKIVVSVNIGSVSTGDAQRDATLPTDDWFAAAAHPKATFTATHIRKIGEGRYLADGTLDLKGVKAPLSLPFTLAIAGDTAKARGTVSIDRTHFGVGLGEWAATDSIPALVKVSFALNATRG